MMQIITAEGGVWVAATTIAGVYRTTAEAVTIKLESGEAVASLERYVPFVERLNEVLLAMAGVEVTRETEEQGAEATITAPSPVTARHGLLASGGSLEPAFP